MKIDWLAPSSRYYGLETRTYVTPDGIDVPYFPRRILPDPARLAVIGEHTVVQNERPDTVAAQVFGDPELFWRLCDGNYVLQPEELTVRLGRRLRVTLPENMPGMPNGVPNG
ncbi:MAG: LysM domain-containing protein [Gemmatimonadales bacterium]